MHPPSPLPPHLGSGGDATSLEGVFAMFELQPAEALAAHFAQVAICFCGRGGYRRSGRGSFGSALFSSFHVVLWPRRLSEKWPRKAHWSLRGFLGSQMLILVRNRSIRWRLVKNMIFFDDRSLGKSALSELPRPLLR